MSDVRITIQREMDVGGHDGSWTRQGDTGFGIDLEMAKRSGNSGRRASSREASSARGGMKTQDGTLSRLERTFDKHASQRQYLGDLKGRTSKGPKFCSRALSLPPIPEISLDAPMRPTMFGPRLSYLWSLALSGCAICLLDGETSRHRTDSFKWV